MPRIVEFNKLIRSGFTWKDSSRFRVFYSDRNSASGPGRGTHGVRIPNFVNICCELLEETLEKLQREFPGGEPYTKEDGRTRVFLLSVDDCQHQGQFLGAPLMLELSDADTGDSYPTLVLSSRSRHWDDAGQFNTLKVTIAHELMHILNA